MKRIRDKLLNRILVVAQIIANAVSILKVLFVLFRRLT